jgi:PAS domain S-box-containing protein
MRFLTSWAEVGNYRKPEDEYSATGHHVTDEQRLLAAIVESSEDAIISSTPAGVILTWNRGAEVIFGYKAGDTIGKRLSMLMAPDRLPELAYFAGQVSQGFTVSQYRSLCRRKDGREFQVSVTGSPLMNSAGEVEALSAILRDISKQEDAEEAIHESEERFRVMADGCPAVMWVTNAEGGIQFINRAYRELIGTTYEETEGHKWQVALHPEDSARYVEAFQRAVRDHAPLRAEARARRADGEWRWMASYGEPRFSTDGEFLGLVGLSLDITERKRTEDALRSSEVRLRGITDSAQDGIVMMDPRGTISYWNPAAQSILGYLHEEAIGKNLHRLLVPERYLAAHRAAFPEFSRNGRGDAVGRTVELAARRKDGREITVDISLSAIRLNDGWHAVGIIRDITSRKAAEAAEQEAKRRAEAATRAKSEFLANMSHEIRTPMNGVIGMTGLLLDTDLTDDQRLYAETVRASGESLLAIVNDILDFSKIEAGRLDLATMDFDLQSLLDDFAATLAVRAHEKRLEFCCIADPEVPTLLSGDPGRLRQILTNLAGNAVKFTRKGEVAVRVSLEQKDETGCLLRFSVRDTGIGIPADKIGILFARFSQVDASTTRTYGGTGLGLAISKQLATMMGGQVGVESTEGVGSQFWFTVRLGRQLKGPETQSRPPANLRGVRAPMVGREPRILLAEDDATNQSVAVGFLKKLGLRADVVANGGEAVKALESVRYDLVLMDVQMPVVDGLTAARQIRDPRSKVRNHAIPIVAMTAQAMQGARECCLDAGMNDYLSKPMSPKDLAEVLVRWLPTQSEELGMLPAAATPPCLPPASAPVVFDRAGLLERVMDDESLAQVVTETFLDDIPRQIEALRGYLDASNAASAERQAHSIKGASASVGGEALRALAFAMEKAGKAGDLGSVRARMDDLEREFVRLKEAMAEQP